MKSSSNNVFLFRSIIFVLWSTLLLSLHFHVVFSSNLNYEGEALLSLLKRFSIESPYYQSINSILNWNNLSRSSSFSSTNPCDWSGISCDTQNKHVTCLDLSRYYISGQLGPQIGRLRYLETIDLSDNNLNGSIPIELWNCSHLQHLDLSWNSFSGVLPEEAVRNLHQLNYFDISFNQLSGRIPKSLFQITGLKVVDLEDNKFNGPIPLNIGNATKMKELDLSSNQLHGNIPSSIANCTKLEDLRMYNNGLSGEIPLEMTTELHHLTYISIFNNHFSGLIPKALGINYTSLEFVNFSNNNFSGEIPPNLCFGKQLINMRLDQNQFHGSIPPSYIGGGGNCYSLRDLNLGKNNLNASLVHNFDKNSSLSSSSICNLTSLDTIDLSENQMYGTLPQCFGDSHQLAILNLRNNHFSGTLPPEFTSDQLYMLDLNGNHFQGKIPRIHSPKLTYLDLGNNQFNDTFPFFFSGDILSDLEILILRSNKLYGPLHTRFAFNNLKVVDISSNYFTGALPTLQFWLGLEAIKHINHTTTDDKEESIINYPTISSVIIYKGIETRLNRTFIDEFRAIDMSNNELQGTIPESIGELLWLKMLNLSNNNLNGRIPSTLGNLIQLESLDLSRNKLSGEIPRHLTDIHSLSVLNLSQNELTGRIPDGAGQFSTFTNDSFIGNPGLCGSPLSIKCGDEPPIQEKESDEEDSKFWNFGWEPVVVGYGCGILIGLVIQYFVFTKAFLYRWFG